MAQALLIMAALFFAVRGFFLGFTGVIARVAGIVLAYVLVLTQRSNVTDYLAPMVPPSISRLVLEIGVSAGLFFLTVLMVTVLVKLLTKSLGTLIPASRTLLDPSTTTARIGGAILNAALAAVLVLSGIWGYTYFTGKHVQPPGLQLAANNLGNSLFPAILEGAEFIRTETTVATQTRNGKTTSRHETRVTKQGFATITSEENPDKQFSITTDAEPVIEAETPLDKETSKAIELLNNIDPSQLQNMLNNEQLQNFARDQYQKDPQKYQQMMNDPKVQALIEKLSGALSNQNSNR